MSVHNHGTEDGPGLSCNERRINGQLRGACMDATPAQAHVTAPQDDEPTTDAHPNRLPSTKPADSRTEFTRHATEAERLAGSTAGLVHALLANAYALAQQEQP